MAREPACAARSMLSRSSTGVENEARFRSVGDTGDERFFAGARAASFSASASAPVSFRSTPVSSCLSLSDEGNSAGVARKSARGLRGLTGEAGARADKSDDALVPSIANSLPESNSETLLRAEREAALSDSTLVDL